MNKEDILKRSRKEHNDEGYLHCMNQTMLLSTRVFLVVIVTLIIFTLVTLRTIELALLLTVLWSYLTAAFIGLQKHGKNNRIVICFSAITAIFSFISYITQVY